LQNISKLVCSEECWTYAIAFDGATVKGRSLLDVGVRLFVNHSFENLHELAIPRRSSHTEEAMADSASALMQVLYGVIWKAKLAGVRAKHDRPPKWGSYTLDRGNASRVLQSSVASTSA
jgi:hypothetical protein